VRFVRSPDTSEGGTTTEMQPRQSRRGDHPVVGGLASIVIASSFAGLGAFLLLEGDSTGHREIVPEVLRLPGLVLMLFCGVAGAAFVAASRSRAERLGWPRAASGAFRVSLLLAIANLALVGLIFVLRFQALRGT